MEEVERMGVLLSRDTEEEEYRTRSRSCDRCICIRRHTWKHSDGKNIVREWEREDDERRGMRTEKEWVRMFHVYE